MKPLIKNCLAFIVLSLILIGCGGGGGSSSSFPSGRLPFPFQAAPSQHYDTSRLLGIRAADVAHMPVYHDATYSESTGAPIGREARNRRLFVGIDQGDAVQNLPQVGTRGKFDIRYGQISDGIGRQSVIDYIFDAGHQGRFLQPPEVRLIGAANTRDYQIVAAAVQIVNQALPEGMKMTMETSLPNYSLRSSVAADGRYFDSGRERDNTIHVEFVPAGQFYSNAGGTTWNIFSANSVEYSYIQFNKGATIYTDLTDRRGVILMAHELLHALGFYGADHVSATFDTILEATSRIYDTRQGIRQPLSLLYPVDREALRAYYSLPRGVSPNALGPWSSVSTHIHGNGPNSGFGVALRNGYAEPWAYGYMPDHDLGHNPNLSGDVTWTGTLLGVTPSAEMVAGNTAISVTLSTMLGQANFTNIEFWPAGASLGEPGSGTTWSDGDLDYSIAIRGNTFRETGGDDGRLSGIFVGGKHEGTAGTLERTDLTAAFGARRDQ